MQHTTLGLYIGFPGISSMCPSDTSLDTINCPGFGWDRVNFFSGACTVVWIQHENSADNSPMFWVLLSRVYPKSRTFILCVCVSLMLCQWGAAQKKTRREHGWDRSPEEAKGIFHTTEHHAKYINWGNYPERSIVHHLFVSPISLSITIIIIFYFVFNY